ncbi:MAG: DUF378 domain-containing protein [Cyanobium sp. MAG06]|nr:DUF378 domain-containing protein [Cyanobium sp. MAG06]
MGVDILLGNKDSAFNIVHFILGGQGGTFSILEAIVYILVGLSAIYLTIVHLSGDNK